MVVWEWIVTDSTIAYASHYWTKRYTNDTPKAWDEMRKKKAFVGFCRIGLADD